MTAEEEMTESLRGHTFDTRSAAASYASGWQTCLRELGRVLAEPGGSIRWEFLAAGGG